MGQKAPSEAEHSAVETLVSDPDLRRLFAYWRDLRRGRPMPTRTDIDPTKIDWALSRIFLLDYDPVGGLVYRLAGDEIAGLFGRGNLKGLRLGDILPSERVDTVEAIFLRVIEKRCIMGMRGMIYLRADRLPIGERLFLPLADGNSGAVNGVLGMTVVHSEILCVPAEVIHAEPRYIPVADIP
ncbi:MAG: PAS domain-containing protein [Kiloniellaceae bacterium]